MKIPLIKPYITQEVKDKVLEVLDSGMLTEGKVTHDLEDLFAEYTGAKYAIAVTSCTTGLEIALRVIGVKPGDEVIVPDYTYPATASVVAILGATPVIVDVDKETMLIDFDKLEKAITNKTKAIIPVSMFGNPLDYTKLNEIKNKYNLIIIEDSACSIGSSYNGIKTGNLADISVFSLHPRKFITTGEGGMITTNNVAWAEWMNSYKHFGIGKSVDRLDTTFEIIGTNYKLSNVQAAIGLVQMKYIDKLLNKRIELSNNYISLLKDNPKVSIPATTATGVHSRQSFCIYVDNRDDIIKKMRAIEIEVQIGTYSLHIQPAYNAKACVHAGEMEGSLYAFKHCLTLPLYDDLTFEQQQRVVEELFKIL